MRPLAVIGHQHQAGGVDVQTPRSVQLIRHRLFQEVEHRRVIRVIRGADIALRLVQHEVTWAVLLFQHIAVKLHDVFRGQFQRTAFDDLIVYSDAFVAQFTQNQCPADAQLLR